MIEAYEEQDNTAIRRKRRIFSTTDKKQIVHEAMQSTVNATAKKYELNSAQLWTWKNSLLAGANDE